MSEEKNIPEWEKELKTWAEEIRPKYEKKEEPKEAPKERDPHYFDELKKRLKNGY